MMNYKFLPKAFRLFLTLFPVWTFAQKPVVRQIKLSRFELQSSAVIKDAGESLSLGNYQSQVHWFPVTVPSTVLTGLVANKIYPDPYIGMNNMLIPDASDEFNKKYNLEQYSFLPNDPNPWKKPYWYRTTFNVPETDKGKFFQLIFKGINYRAAVWLNGHQIADSTQMAGMFAEYNLDVSKQVKPGGKNVLAVKIYPLDYPGLPSTPQLKALGDFYSNGGPTGDIGKNVTMLCSAGWDWMPAVRDRNMGIWQPVYLRTSGQVTIARPQIKTELPNLPDTTKATISLNLSLVNHDAKSQAGQLIVTINPENFKGEEISFSQPVSIPAGQTQEISLNSQSIRQLSVQHPKLWWPNGYGEPNLYRIRLQYTDGNTISDDTTFVFGIRTVSSKVVNVNGWPRRDFYVNGKRVHLVGGAWVPDMMLNRDSLRYDYEMRLCRNANVNLVRIWGGGVTPPDDFFESADRYGLMVWNDFWITGDTQGEFKGSPDWPLEGNIFIKNVISTIYRLRNHASLLVWTGGNEGHARKELYEAMRNNIADLDGTRPFIPSSSGFAKLPEGWKGSWPDNEPSGVYSGGPYSWQDPAEYYKKVNAGKDWVFKDETGIPSQPPYSVLPKIISNLVPDKNLPFPLNNTWGYHDACTGAGKFDDYYKTLVTRFGEPESMEDFCDKAQLLNADGYRGIFESAASKLNETGGVMLWKLNAAFPSVIWQIYDWYLMPNAGYYFMQNACEPVHVQLNLDGYKVAVVNRTYHPQNKLTLQAEVIDINGKFLFHDQNTLNLNQTEVKESTGLKNVLAKTKGVSFVILKLNDASGKLISSNTYWIAADRNFQSLSSMKNAEIQAKVINSEKDGNNYKWKIRFSNRSQQLAFFVNPQIIQNAEEVLPSFWSSNYFSIPTGESITLTVSCPIAAADSTALYLKLKGWNVKEQAIKL